MYLILTIIDNKFLLIVKSLNNILNFNWEQYIVTTSEITKYIKIALSCNFNCSQTCNMMEQFRNQNRIQHQKAVESD